MEVVELLSLLLLDVLGVAVVEGVGGTDDGEDEGHPTTSENFGIIIDFVVH